MKRCLMILGLVGCIGSMNAATLKIENDLGRAITVKVGVQQKQVFRGNPWTWETFSLKSGSDKIIEGVSFYDVKINDGAKAIKKAGFGENQKDSYKLYSSDFHDLTPKQFKKKYGLTLTTVDQ